MAKTAVITGASRGIGRAIAEKLASEGYNIALVSRDYGKLESVSQELMEKYKVRAFPFECNILSEEKIEETFKKIIEKLGSINILVNNAGVNSRRTLGKLNCLKEDLEGFKQEISTNLTGTYLCSYIAAGYMLGQGSGSIINISSVKGKESTTSPGYGASKAGVIKLTKDFAKALAQFGIRVNCIAPGFIDTGMTSELPEEKKQEYKKMIPLRRFGTVEEIARVAVFLASDNASYITGATIDVNGGYLMT